LERVPQQIVIRLGGQVIADTTAAFRVQEATMRQATTCHPAM
jgi:uncharacterized protein (DUF427 family)